jgi:low affinity Fe/Cu permease
MRPIKTTNSFFTLCSKATARATGRPQAFLAALGVVVVWGATGPFFHYSNTWQLVINTGTTVITFLMVFLIQATQNRDSEAVHQKLDELIRAMHGAHNALLDLEELEQKDLDKIRENYLALAKLARDEVKVGRVQTGRKDQKG